MGRIFLDCTSRSLVLVLSCFPPLLFSFITLADVLNSLISRYLLPGCRLHLGIREKLVLKSVRVEGCNNLMRCVTVTFKFRA